MKGAKKVVSKLRIGSRGSKLALWQSEYIKKILLDSNPEMSVEIEIIKTRGDRIQDVALSRVGGKGLFTKELEDSLLAGEIRFCGAQPERPAHRTCPRD